LKDVEWKLICELMKNSRRSDRDLAKAIRSSQPTITRMRNRLEKEGHIREYTMIPDFRKLGFENLAITFVKFTRELTSETITNIRKAGRKLESQTPTPTILIMRGMGLGYDGVVISLHKNYASFMELARMTKQLPFVDISRVESFLVNLADENPYRHLILSAFANYISKLKEKGNQNYE